MKNIENIENELTEKSKRMAANKLTPNTGKTHSMFTSGELN